MMGKRKNLLQSVLYVVVLLIAMIVLFYWYTAQNRTRIAEQNRNYAEDAALQTAQRIDDDFENGLDLINTYAHFIGISLSEPKIDMDDLKSIENNSVFDAIRFTDMKGRTYSITSRNLNE